MPGWVYVIADCDCDGVVLQIVDGPVNVTVMVLFCKLSMNVTVMVLFCKLSVNVTVMVLFTNCH